MVMFIGQLSGRKSLRDIVMNVAAQSSKLYHLVIRPCSRATLARVNPWAPFRKTKGAVKLHVGLDADGYLPTFISLSEGKTHESNWANALKLPRDSVLATDVPIASTQSL